ncbi:MAG: UDP-N-acetylmuramate dehydrogenase [bacterium]|nr:UDP-N-acetylmuramate dehydrogenase [bacterium]
MNDARTQLEHLPGIKLDEPLAAHTTFQVGGPASYFISSNDVPVIQKAVQLAAKAGLPVAALGGGSNVLVADAGFAGLIVQLTSTYCAVHPDGTVVADAGTVLSRVVRSAISANLTGIEFAVGIPGSFGGGLAGNAGTGGHGIAEYATQVTYLNAKGELRTCPRAELDVSYRYTRFKYANAEIILSGTLQLATGTPTAIQALVREAVERRSWQPKGAWCAGCVFKNPSGGHAGKIIEQAGLKGKKIGGAMVSTDHANFVMNTGTATAEDIVILISYVKQQVRDQLGVQLEEEVRYLGFDSKPSP